MKKAILTLGIILFTHFLFSQTNAYSQQRQYGEYVSSYDFTKAQSRTISCQKLFNVVTKNYENKDYVTCYNSSMLSKAQYFKYDGKGFVVVYIKSNEYDIYGKPYIFCGISKQRWDYFKSSGMYGSWGKAYHKYIKEYVCNCN